MGTKNAGKQSREFAVGGEERGDMMVILLAVESADRMLSYFSFNELFTSPTRSFHTSLPSRVSEKGGGSCTRSRRTLRSRCEAASESTVRRERRG